MYVAKLLIIFICNFIGSKHQDDGHNEIVFAASGSRTNMCDISESSFQASSHSRDDDYGHREVAISLDDIQLVDMSPCDNDESKNPYNLKIGSTIQYGTASKCGVIKWIGYLHDDETVVYAGVEMVMFG